MTAKLLTMKGTGKDSVFYVLNRSEMGVQLGIRGLAEPAGNGGIAVGLRIRAAHIPNAKVKASHLESTVKKLYPKVKFTSIGNERLSGLYVAVLPVQLFKPGVIEEAETEGLSTKLKTALVEHLEDVYMDQDFDTVWAATVDQMKTGMAFAINMISEPEVPYVYNPAGTHAPSPQEPQTPPDNIVEFKKSEPDDPATE